MKMERNESVCLKVLSHLHLLQQCSQQPRKGKNSSVHQLATGEGKGVASMPRKTTQPLKQMESFLCSSMEEHGKHHPK